MNTIILMIGMTAMSVLLIGSVKMNKKELAEWFAETVGVSDPQNPINHLRCEPGKWMRITTSKFSFCTLGELSYNGFGIPGYFLAREGWESKKALIAKCFDSGKWEMVTAGCIKDLEGKVREVFSKSDFELFNIFRDDHLVWYELNPKYIHINPDYATLHTIESLQFTFDRAKKGHDGTATTAPYSIGKKGFVTNEIPHKNPKKSEE